MAEARETAQQQTTASTSAAPADDNPAPSLSPEPADLADFESVADSVETLLSDSMDDLGPALVRLAWQCASTFRQSELWRRPN